MMFDPVTMIKVGTKVQILCAVCSLGTERSYHAAGAVLTVDSKAGDRTWNLKDNQGILFPDVPAQYLSPVG